MKVSRRKRIPETDSRVERRPNSTFRGVYRCGSVYIHVNKDDESAPFRVLLNKGHTGNCQQALLEAIGRLVTLILQESDIPPDRVRHTLIGINCGEGMVKHLSCMDDLARAVVGEYDELEKKGKG
jgi:hypothetical protein